MPTKYNRRTNNRVKEDMIKVYAKIKNTANTLKYVPSVIGDNVKNAIRKAYKNIDARY